MRIGLVNFTLFKYQINTPQGNPLGGEESALCYLSESLATRRHRITIFEKSSNSFESSIIQHAPTETLSQIKKFHPWSHKVLAREKLISN